jgi:hypothetical protein
MPVTALVTPGPMAAIAGPLLEVVLEPEDESAPVWRP